MHIDEDFNLADALKKRGVIKPKKIQKDEPLLLIRFNEGVLIKFKDSNAAIILDHGENIRGIEEDAEAITKRRETKVTLSLLPILKQSTR